MGFYDFLAISRYVHIHRSNDVKHPPVKHGSIKHAPDFLVYVVANFAFVDNRHRLGCKQSLVTCAASFEVGCRIPCPPAWRRPGVHSSDGQLSGLRIAPPILDDVGNPEPARTMVVSSVFAADIPPARRALRFAKARGPLPGSLGLPAGGQNKPRETSKVRCCMRRTCAVMELFRIL